MRKLEAEKKELSSTLDRMKRQTPPDQTAIGVAEKQVAHLDQEIEALKTEVPANWDADHKAFETLQKADSKARRDYRRAADTAYKSVAELMTVVEGAPALEAMRSELEGLRQVITSQEPKAASETIKQVSRKFRKVAGVKDIRSGLSKARKQLRGRNPKPEKAAEELEKAIAAFEADVAWRKKANAELLPGHIGLECGDCLMPSKLASALAAAAAIASADGPCAFCCFAAF